MLACMAFSTTCPVGDFRESLYIRDLSLSAFSTVISKSINCRNASIIMLLWSRTKLVKLVPLSNEHEIDSMRCLYELLHSVLPPISSNLILDFTPIGATYGFFKVGDVIIIDDGRSQPYIGI